jgi:hypothetical protein
MNADKPGGNNTGLPDDVKSGIEILAGNAMDKVEVHCNSAKTAQLQADNCARGTDISLSPGKHLPHEAWHIVEQKKGRVKPAKQMKDKVKVNDNCELEKAADAMGENSADHT